MKYLVLIQEHADDFAKRNHPEDAEAYWQSWSIFSDIIRKADPDYTGAALQPPETATTISASGIEDGPFADTKEQLGGFFIINVENLDIALDIAFRQLANVQTRSPPIVRLPISHRTHLWQTGFWPGPNSSPLKTLPYLRYMPPSKQSCFGP